MHRRHALTRLSVPPTAPPLRVLCHARPQASEPSAFLGNDEQGALSDLISGFLPLSQQGTPVKRARGSLSTAASPMPNESSLQETAGFLKMD
jgi:hypothetical protein